MHKHILILIITGLILLSPVAGYSGKWSKTDTTLQVVASSFIIADWLQTRQIAKHPERWYETNPLLGKHPSLFKVDSYFIGSMLLNTAIPILLNQPYRRLWQLGIIGLEFHYVRHNYSIGIKVKF